MNSQSKNVAATQNLQVTEDWRLQPNMEQDSRLAICAHFNVNAFRDLKSIALRIAPTFTKQSLLLSGDGCMFGEFHNLFMRNHQSEILRERRFWEKTCEKLTPCLCKHGGHVIYNRLEKLIFGSFLKTSKKKNLKDKNKFTQKSFFFFLFWEVSLNFLLTTQRFRRDVSGRSLSPTVQR